MQLFYHFPIEGLQFQLEPEESKHLLKVLRKKEGDTIYFTDGIGHLYFCQIHQISQKSVLIKVLEKQEASPAPFSIHLAIAPTKNADRMEWLTEKAVEIGMDELILMKTENSERNFLKPDRLEKKSISAMKQSLKTFRTEITDTMPFEQIIQDPRWIGHEKFIAYVDEEIPHHLLNLASPGQKYLVLVGPEGDFSAKEIQMAVENGFKPCSLGKSRLRTETAGLAAVHTLNLLNL